MITQIGKVGSFSTMILVGIYEGFKEEFCGHLDFSDKSY
jgi:hypothetical protein